MISKIEKSFDNNYREIQLERELRVELDDKRLLAMDFESVVNRKTRPFAEIVDEIEVVFGDGIQLKVAID